MDTEDRPTGELQEAPSTSGDDWWITPASDGAADTDGGSLGNGDEASNVANDMSKSLIFNN